MKKMYRDCYGGIIAIKKLRNGKFYLSARTCYGDIYHKGEYETFKGAKIALGRITEGMYTEVA